MLCWGVIKVLGATAASQETSLLSLAPNPSMLEGGDPNAMLGDHKSPGNYCFFTANSFDCLQLTIHNL